jgi:hypothetical protein
VSESATPYLGGPRTASNGQPTAAAARSRTLLLAGVAAGGILVRLAHVRLLPIVPFDPWRHLALVRNLADGRGFVLFDDQLYTFYSPFWYVLAALVWPHVNPASAAAVFGGLSTMPAWIVGNFYGGRRGAWMSALGAAFLGQLIYFSTTYGGEALSVTLLWTAWALCCTGISSRARALAAGLILGVALLLRPQLLIAILPLVVLVRRHRAAALLAAALPAAGQALANFANLARFPFIYGWDGLAVPRASVTLPGWVLGSLDWRVLGQAAAYYGALVKPAGWKALLTTSEMLNQPGLIAFILAGTVACLLSKRPALLITGLVGLSLPLMTRNWWFGRHWITLMPVYLAALASLGALDSASGPGPRRKIARVAAMGTLLALLAMGLPMIGEATPMSLASVIPPTGMLPAAGSLAVQGGDYHPESIVWAYPALRVIGLPSDPSNLRPMLRSEATDLVLLHEPYGICPRTAREVATSRDFRLLAIGRNPFGVTYRLYRFLAAAPPPRPLP